MVSNSLQLLMIKYSNMLDRKEKILRDKKYVEGCTDSQREIEYNKLDAEINLLRSLIEDIKAYSIQEIF